MSKSLRVLKDVYTPFSAIIAYRAEGVNYEKDSFFLEKRNITQGRMGVGKPLTEKEFALLLQNVRSSNGQLDNSIHGAIPANVLYCNTSITNEKLVWYRPAEERYVFFKSDLEIPNGKMRVPGLLYVVTKDKLAMYAFKGKKPDKLYRAPFMNVSAEYVCLGNSKVKKPEDRTFAKVIAYWETMFWKSEFSHILGGNPIKGNLAVLTKHLIETGEAFPTEELCPVKISLKSILK